jgi:hypothetical protein
MTSQLNIEITSKEPLCGVARRFGFELAWTAVRDGHGWLVEVPRGHALGPEGKGAFEIVTAGDWPAFARAIQRHLDDTILRMEQHR